MPFTCHISGSQSGYDPGAILSNFSLQTGEHDVIGVSGYESGVVYLVDNLNQLARTLISNMQCRGRSFGSAMLLLKTCLEKLKF